MIVSNEEHKKLLEWMFGPNSGLVFPAPLVELAADLKKEVLQAEVVEWKEGEKSRGE